MTARDLVDDLTFAAYAHNRDIAPHVTPERWAKVFPNAAAMEERYQHERANGRPRELTEVELERVNGGAA
jgi:hypothetical protein